MNTSLTDQKRQIWGDCWAVIPTNFLKTHTLGAETSNGKVTCSNEERYETLKISLLKMPCTSSRLKSSISTKVPWNSF